MLKHSRNICECVFSNAVGPFMKTTKVCTMQNIQTTVADTRPLVYSSQALGKVIAFHSGRAMNSFLVAFKFSNEIGSSDTAA